MKKRVITGVGIAAVFIPLIFFSEFVTFPIFFALLSCTAIFELLRVRGLVRDFAVSLPLLCAAALLPAGIWTWHKLAPDVSFPEMLPAVFGVLTLLLMILFFLAVVRQGNLTFADVCYAFVTSCYALCGFSAISGLQTMAPDSRFVFLVFFVSFGSDTWAYFIGVLFGKHKLIPKLSPKKTVEGAIGGILGGGAMTVLYGFLFSLIADVSPKYLILFLVGMALSLVSQIGDLLASLIKREAGIKDYGNVLPGHGGIMDRFDSVIAVATVLAIICLVLPIPLF